MLLNRRMFVTLLLLLVAIVAILLPVVSTSSTTTAPIPQQGTNHNHRRRKIVLGIDGGTESIRACFFDAITGCVVGQSCSASYPTYHPYPGYAEQDPKDWWTSCRIAVRQAIQSIHDAAAADDDDDAAAAPILSSASDVMKDSDDQEQQQQQHLSSSLLSAYEICAVTIDTTCCSVVALDTTMQPLRNCLLWMDQRSVLQTQQILQKCQYDPAIQINNHGFGPISAEWMIPKAMWIQQQEPNIWEQTRIICEYQDYINYQLTNIVCSSACNAITRWHYDGTTTVVVDACNDNHNNYNYNDDDDNHQNYNIDHDLFPKRPYSMYDTLGISDLGQKLPSKCISMGTIIGTMTNTAAIYLGLPTQYDIPVVQGGPDAFVGMIGLGCIESGQLCLITGSSHLHCIITSQPNTAPGIWGTYQNAPLPTLNFAEGGQSSTGSILRWAKRLFGGIDHDDNNNNNNNNNVTYKVLDAEAERIAPGSDGLVALETFQGSRTPTTDPLARGALIGLTLSHTRGHIWRALMESVCYGTRACIEGLADAGHTCEEIIIAGGVTRSDIWLQMHADITGKIVTVCENSDAPLLGCAILASTGVGIYSNVPDAVRAMVRTLKQIHPNKETTKTYDTLYKTGYKKMLPTVQPIVHSLHTLRGGGGGGEEVYESDVPPNNTTTKWSPGSTESISTMLLENDNQQDQPPMVVGKEIVIAPSLLACDWANIEREVHRCCSMMGTTINNNSSSSSSSNRDGSWLQQPQQSSRIHIDIFDGVYINSPAALTFGPQMVQAIRDSILSYHRKNNNNNNDTTTITTTTTINMIMDLHMCVVQPERFVEIMNHVTTGVDCCFIFQWEAMNHNLTRAIALIHQITNTNTTTGSGNTTMKCGISINPSTNIDEIYPLLLAMSARSPNHIAVIDILAVEPGFGGQTFQSEVTLHKVQALHHFRNNLQQRHQYQPQQLPFQIMIDGGMNNETCIDVVRMGADILVVGTYLFQQHSRNLMDGIHAIQHSLCTGKRITTQSNSTR